MKRSVFILFLLFTTALSSAVHKYYAAVFTIEHSAKKQQLQMTARIFVDDLEVALKRKYGKNLYLGTSTESEDAKAYLQKYLSEKITLEVNGSAVPLKFIGKEMEDDIIICYCTFPASASPKSIEMKNKVLMEVFPDQQNIVHANINRNKKSLLLTNDETAGTLQF